MNIKQAEKYVCDYISSHGKDRALDLLMRRYINFNPEHALLQIGVYTIQIQFNTNSIFIINNKLPMDCWCVDQARNIAIPEVFNLFRNKKN